MSQGYSQDNPETIKGLFGSIANRYDLTNSFLTLHCHRLWNRKLVRALPASESLHLLDLCAGTGEIGYLWLQQNTHNKVTFVDFCKEMLEIAKKRNTLGDHLSFVEADACALPFQDSSFDCCSMAYGLRNIHNREKALHEAFRTLKPAGTLAILDLTAPSSPFIAKLHAAYLRYVVPTIGGLVTGNKAAFSYLSSSIQHFATPQEIASLLHNAGFTEVKAIPLFFGTTHLFVAKKP